MQRRSFRRGFQEFVEEKVEKRAVNLGQGGKIRELDPLVHLVHGQSDEAKFGDWTVARIKRASEVPPVVLNSGVLPVTCRIASARQSLSIPGAATNASPLTETSSV